MCVWVVALVLLGSLVYLNQVGLPWFVKRPLLQKLHDRGLDLQFSRLRLRWYQGIVADNVRFVRANEPFSPQLFLSEVQVQLNAPALARFQLQVDSLTLRQGRLIWPIAETNQPPRQLAFENIKTGLRLLPNDEWSLDNFTANIAGAKIQLTGAVTNASAVRDWKFLQAKRPTAAGLWQYRLRLFADAVERIHFSAPPELKLDVRGDARDLQSFRVHLMINTPGAVTPWGAVSQGLFTARLYPDTNQLSHADFDLEAADAQTQWGTTTNLQFNLHFASVEREPDLVSAHLSLTAAQLESRWGSATNAQFNAQWLNSLTNPAPLSGEGRLACADAQTQWGSATNIQLSAKIARSSAAAVLASPVESWTWWTNLAAYAIDWEGHLSRLQTPKIAALEVAVGGSWCAPELIVTNLHALVYQGKLDASVRLDAVTRALRASFISDFDPHKVSPLLTEGARRWLSDYSWQQPPDIKAEVALVLPAWTNRHPDWQGDVRPTVAMSGEFKIANGGAYRQVAVGAAQSRFSYSNMFWQLDDLLAARPEGRVEAAYRADDRTKDYYWRIHSTIDVNALRPLLQTNHLRGLDFFTFTQPPEVQAEIWGRWHEPERIGFKGRVALTNCTFRDQPVTDFESAFVFTNRLLGLSGAHAASGTQHLSAAAMVLDFEAQKIYLTNGFGIAAPELVTRAIGPRVARIMEPYQFGHPPTAYVHGIIPMRRPEDADVHFDLEGGPFHWLKFNVPQISGHIHWVGERLTLTDVHTDFYGGKAVGAATLNFQPEHHTEYRFSIATTNTLIRPLMMDITSRTNRLEGLLNGNLVITRANTADLQSVNGYGSFDLRDGLLWDIPMFGIFSEVLNGVAPGLGRSRASAGAGTFAITNGVIRTEDLEIHSSAMRLLYRGTLDLEGRVNARVEAELLRDMKGLGPIISTVFWPVTKMFEYRVAGTVRQPKSEPVFIIPRIVLMPFHPLRSIRDMMPEDTASAPTNAPLFKLP